MDSTWLCVNFCHDFIPLSNDKIKCLLALLHDRQEYYHHCHFRMGRRDKLMPWSITKATSGALISAINHVNSTKSAGLQEVFLTNGRFSKRQRFPSKLDIISKHRCHIHKWLDDVCQAVLHWALCYWDWQSLNGKNWAVCERQSPHGPLGYRS